MQNIIFFGPPGAGKGTQAKIISNHLNIPHLSTGDILRSKTKQSDDLAIQLKNIISSGKLVSDEILNEIVSKKLIEECNNGFILDGYPRTLNQAHFINKFFAANALKINFIFNIEIDFNILKQRILKRSLEEKRDDDKLSVLETRYNEYVNTTKKVSDKYFETQADIFHKIDGIDEIDEITSKIKKILEN